MVCCNKPPLPQVFLKLSWDNDNDAPIRLSNIVIAHSNPAFFVALLSAVSPWVLSIHLCNTGPTSLTSDCLSDGVQTTKTFISWLSVYFSKR